MESISSLEQADLILVIGSNTFQAHHVIGERILRAAKKGKTLIVIDPRRTEMADHASLSLQINPGTDAVLLQALSQVIISEGLYDESFIERATDGFEAYCQSVRRFTPEYAASICGTQPDTIRQVARRFAQAPTASIVYGLGITEHHIGTQNVMAIGNLALLTGHIGHMGDGIMPLRGQNNVQGSGDMGCLPDTLPGSVPVSDPLAREHVEACWGAPVPLRPGKTVPRMLEGIEEGAIHGLLIFGEDPVKTEGNSARVKEQLQRLDLLVVADLFLTETAQLADVVLPALSWLENNGTFTNTERRVQRVRPTVKGPAESKEDWQIVAVLANRLGFPMHYHSAEDIWNEVRQVAPRVYGGMSYARLEVQGLQYPCATEEDPGMEVLYADLHAARPAMHAHFQTVHYEPPVETPDKQYPFVLITGRRYEQYNAHTQTRFYLPNVHLKFDHETVDISPTDAEKLHLKDGQQVEVRSRRGHVNVPVRITREVPQGVVFMSFHWSEVPTNRLTVDAYDPISGTTEVKQAAVSISPPKECEVIE